MWRCQCLTLGLKMGQKHYILLSLGPKALNYESVDPELGSEAWLEFRWLSCRPRALGGLLEI